MTEVGEAHFGVLDEEMNKDTERGFLTDFKPRSQYKALRGKYRASCQK